MRLLGLAPGSLKHQAVIQLQHWIESQLGHHTLNDVVGVFEQERLAHHLDWNRRWYDDFENGPLLFEMLKKTPSQTKSTVADVFLQMLKDVTPVNGDH